MNLNEIMLRMATPDDAKAILELVRELAIYEKAEEAIKTKEEDYKDGIRSNLFQTLVAIHQVDGIIGMALFFPYFSTWGGRTMYLEDFIVKEKYRRSGVGSLLFEAFLEHSQMQGAKKVKWQVLDWNESAKSFYKKYGALIIPGWENGVIEFE